MELHNYLFTFLILKFINWKTPHDCINTIRSLIALKTNITNCLNLTIYNQTDSFYHLKLYPLKSSRDEIFSVFRIGTHNACLQIFAQTAFEQMSDPDGILCHTTQF